jgi:hypothetical protein
MLFTHGEDHGSVVFDADSDPPDLLLVMMGDTVGRNMRPR